MVNGEQSEINWPKRFFGWNLEFEYPATNFDDERVLGEKKEILLSLFGIECGGFN